MSEFATSPRPDTGLTDRGLGMLFLFAAEAMFFGSLLSAVVLIRVNLPADAPTIVLNRLAGSAGVACLLAATAGCWINSKRRSSTRVLRVIATLASLGYLLIKAFESLALVESGETPAVDVRYALVFTLNGVLMLHVFIVIVILIMRLWKAQFAPPHPAQDVVDKHVTWLLAFLSAVGIIFWFALYVL